MGGDLPETYIRIGANALDEQNAKLGLPRLDRLVKQLTPVQCAVGRVQNANRATTGDEVVEQLLKCVEGKLLAHLGRFRVLGIKELGRLI